MKRQAQWNAAMLMLKNEYTTEMSTLSDLVVGGLGGLNPQLFSQPPSFFYEICLGGRLQPPQLFHTSHKI